MTSALIPLAASSLLALSSGAPGGQGAPQAGQGGQPTHQVAQAPRGQGPGAQMQRPAVQAQRPAASMSQARQPAARTAAPQSSHARTAPDRGASSSAQAAGGSSGAPPRGSSSHAVQAHPNGGTAVRPTHHAARPAHHAARPAHHYAPWDPTPHRVYVSRHYHVAPWHPRYWTAGVFVYEAPPRPVAVAGRPASARTAAPQREVERSNTVSLGLRSGTYMSGYENGASYSDFGVGLAARYRGNEALGLEVAYGYYNDEFTNASERVTQPLSASVELFAFPWTDVSPYVLGGVTWTKRSYSDTYETGMTTATFEQSDVQFGPHGGVGLELAVGEKSSLSLEGRYTHFVTHEEGEDASAPGNLQGTLGLNVYF